MELVIISVCLILIANIIFFAGGVYLGRIMNSQSNTQTPVSFFDKNVTEYKQNSPKISIDDTKVVLGISTEGLEKKHENFAKESATENTISSSINKLKKMKG